MERIFTCSVRKNKVFSATKILLLIGLFCLHNQLLKAQCNLVAPYICVVTNSAASNVTTTTVDISAMSGTSHWQWMQQVGVVWSTTPGPTVTTHLGIHNGVVTTVPNGGSMTAFTITGLTPGTTYYLRSFGTYDFTNEATTVYGPPISFTTTPSGPIGMSTTAASLVGPTSASTGGTVTVLSGSPTITERGVVYATTANPTTISGTKVISGAGIGTYTTNLTGLSSSTTYYARAYSIDNLGNIYYGSNQVFTTSFLVSGVISPFSLSPAWYFGSGARYTFPSGSFPAVPPGPTVGYISTNNSTPVETSTSVSFRDGSVATYTNTMQAFNGASSGSWMSNIRNFSTDGTCGGSSTGGAVAFPDPANNATNDAFYMVIGNDLTSGGCAGAGINRYRFTGTGTGVVHNAGPDLVATSAISSEAITAGTDGSGGYWVVSHDQAANNNFYVWHYTASGMSAMATYSPATSAPIAVTDAGGYLKFSPCMDKIAFAGFSGSVSVYNFNRVTGAIGTEIASLSGIGKVGLEFSPDGSKIYYSGQGTVVSWFLISNPATGGTVAGSNSWTMQMGPDAQIYTSGITSATTVGVITNANSGAPGHTAMPLTSPGSAYRGISNIAWLSPQLPRINYVSSGCNTYNFTYLFKNYFNDDITIKTGSYSWNFGDLSALGTGTAPSHTYPVGTNSYTVTLTFRDSCCNQLWTATTTVNTTCTSLPANLISFTGHKDPEGNILYWATTSELNNDYFEIMKSDDGINFYSIGQVKGSNQSSGVSNYDFLDYSSNNKSVSYYYLAQYDLDGTLTKSAVIAIRSSVYTPVISPNPSSSSFKISLPYDKAATVTVLDVLGRTLEQKTMEVNTAFVTVGEELSKGSYLISIVTENDSFFYKVIKE